MSTASAAGILHVVATPIGNLGDLSPRALDTLRAVAAICAEDTRHTRQLLSHYGVEQSLIALHEHNEAGLAERIVARLLAGESLALVSDAGTPLVSDPGFRLVAAARAAGIKVSPIPGPSALIAALSVAGLPSDRFAFEGFLPAKAGARRERFAELASEPLCHPGVYDFGASDLAVRLRDAGLKLSLDRDFWHTPPADALFLHRKLGGLYLLAARLGARVDVGRLAEPWLG